MDNEILISKCLDLNEGHETPESWWSWWNSHEMELEALLNRGAFLRLKPRKHDSAWVSVFTSQKGAMQLLEGWNIPFQASSFYQEQYLDEFNSFTKEKQRIQRGKQKDLKAKYPELFALYPKFAKVLAEVLDFSDEIKQGSSLEEIFQIERALDFALPDEVQQFFRSTKT